MLPATRPTLGSRKIRVMLVDDSAIVRGLVTRWIEAEPDMELVASASDGAVGLRKVAEAQPDVLLLDIEMPNMDGLQALPQLIAAKPGLKVVMSSTLTTRGAAITMKALELGAADYVAKPDSSRIGGADGFRQELFAKVRALAARAVGLRATTLDSGPPPSATHAPSSAPTPPMSRPVPRSSGAAPAYPVGPRKVDLLAVGSSTGGPPALRTFLTALGPDWKAPIVIVQHMPATFTPILAEHLGKALPLRVVEAKSGQPVEPRTVYIAPGDFHMTVRTQGGVAVLHLDQNPPENWCRPAVDPMLRSVAQVYGDRALTVILTGMGHDGRAGASEMLAKGGVVMAQDEASSVVWGMPGAVVEAGLAHVIRPLDGLAAACKAISRGERP